MTKLSRASAQHPPLPPDVDKRARRWFEAALPMSDTAHLLGAALPDTPVARAIAAYDWSGHPLGQPGAWPPALASLVRMMLACPTPMYLAWGAELTSFYNDAYLPLLGVRLGGIGTPFRELWHDIWDAIGPLVDSTLAGESRSMTDMKLDLARRGMPEESWWSFTYSPVFDDAGAVAGLFCVTRETTDRVLAEQARAIADQRLQLALSAGNSIGAWDWDVATNRVTADARFALLYGLDPTTAAAGAPIAEFFRGIHPEDLPRVRDEIASAMQTREVFSSEYRLVGDDGETRWVLAQGRCLYDDEGTCVRFPGVSFDVSQRTRATLALQAAVEEREFVVDLTRRQRDLSNPEAVLRLSLEALGARFAADRVGFYRALPNGRVRYGPCWTNGRMPPITGETEGDRYGERMRLCREQGVTLVYADTRHDPVGGLEELAQDGIVAGLCHPLLRHGRFVAGIFIHVGSVRAWPAADIALVREVAELTLLAVERAEALIRLEDRLGQQEDALASQAGELREEVAGRNAAESQVRQLQKMEAVGQLTGGIAHDFNNMLAVVIGGLNLMQRRLARGDADVGRYVEAAMDGATRAAALTQRLLAFSRQSPLAPEAIDANALVRALTDLLDRTLGEQVRLETVQGAGLWRLRADPGQLENAIVNLAVNARDAMPEGGQLTIETSNAHLDELYAVEEGLKVGQYVLVAVTDTGMGMAPAVLAKAFEPFFTTKGVGKGTGLGLSQVFGFVRQSGGHVKIYSEEGHGTTVKIYLPRHYGEGEPVAARRRLPAPRGGTPDEIIMVVEDEERLRTFTTEALRELGYTVVHAEDGAQALAMMEAGQGATLLFTDIIMPGMTGRQLADVAIARIPGLKVLYMTGYTRNAVVHNGTLDPGTNFLAKPFGLDELAAKVRAVLDA